MLLLLQAGLKCNKTVLQSVVDMVQSVRTYPDMSCIYELLLALLQYGADPNIELKSLKGVSGGNPPIFGEFIRPIAQSAGESSGNGNGGGSRDESLRNSFRNNNNAKNYILFYYIMLITRKEFILTDPEATYTRIIYLLYFTMKHEILYNCLKNLHNLFIAQVPNKLTDNLINLISTLYRRPRSLKELCRLRIYESLNKKIAQNINRLNLPGPLKDYVLNFE